MSLRSCLLISTTMGLLVVAISLHGAPSPAHSQSIELLTITGSAAGDFLGQSVSSAGDMNGDGFNDVIIGADRRAYVYFGGPYMDAVADIAITDQENRGVFFGFSVSDAGDVNGDGYDDVLVGAAQFGAGTGAAYVYYGGPRADAEADLTFTGAQGSSMFGISVSGAGDMNGDGFADVIVGAWNDAGGAGRAYVYYGGASMDEIADIIFTGEAPGDHFGFSVSDAGDVNGDGFADVIVGAPEAFASSTTAGRAYVYFGGPISDAVPDMVLTGSPYRPYFGTAVSSAGDVDGNGVDDVIVGEWQRIYVYFGGDDADTVADLVSTIDTYGVYGSVSSAGDVNRDGFADIIVGGGTGSLSDLGHAYVLFGGAAIDPVVDVEIDGEAAGDGTYGFRVSDAGDVNGDGYADVIVGAGTNDVGGSDAGRVYILSMRPPTFALGIELHPRVLNLASRALYVTAYLEPNDFDPTRIDISSVRLAGAVPAEMKFATLGDHDHDGLADLAIKFNRPALDPFLSPGMNTLEVTGTLLTGEHFSGSDVVTVINPPEYLPTASVSPNPLNPVGVLTLRTTRPGPVTVRMFDLQGRLVRTLVEAQVLQAGVHEVNIEDRGAHGEILASGVYFYRVETAEGAVSGRVALLK